MIQQRGYRLPMTLTAAFVLSIILTLTGALNCRASDPADEATSCLERAHLKGNVITCHSTEKVDGKPTLVMALVDASRLLVRSNFSKEKWQGSFDVSAVSYSGPSLNSLGMVTSESLEFFVNQGESQLFLQIPCDHPDTAFFKSRHGKVQTRSELLVAVCRVE